MKKVLCILLIAALILSLTGCTGMAVKNTEKAIADIGEVTVDSGRKITAAREAYDQLPEKDRAKVSNIDELSLAEKAYAVISTEDTINGLRRITSATQAKLEEALEMYYRLDPELRAQINNSGMLEDTREILAAVEAIDAIGDVTPGSGERIDRAQARFDLLDPQLQERVPNRERIEASRNILKVVEAIELIPEAPPYVKEDVLNAQALYDALDPDLRINVGNYERLQAAREYGELMDLKDEELWSGVYKRACEYQDRYEMEEALNYFRQLPDDYRDSAERIVSVESYLTWYAARTEIQGKWVWDGQPAEASDGTVFPADYKSITITETEDPGEFEDISLREKRLFYAEIKTESQGMDQFNKTVLYYQCHLMSRPETQSQTPISLRASARTNS